MGRTGECLDPEARSQSLYLKLRFLNSLSNLSNLRRPRRLVVISEKRCVYVGLHLLLALLMVGRVLLLLRGR